MHRNTPSAVKSMHMCGIVGYVGAGTAERDAKNVIVEGLRRLEYRGYDSAGVAAVSYTHLTLPTTPYV